MLECGENTYLSPWILGSEPLETRVGRTMSCVETCPDGYFGLDGAVKELGGPKIGGTCEGCLGHATCGPLRAFLGACQRCSSATSCERCKDGSYLNPLTQRCSMACPSDYYMSGHGAEGRVCKPCPSEAASCVNESFIFECRGNNQYLAPGGLQASKGQRCA